MTMTSSSLAADIMNLKNGADGLRSNANTPVLLEEDKDKDRSSTSNHNRVQSQDNSKRKRRTSSLLQHASSSSRSRNEVESLPPTSPALVFRNLLTLEESLRQEYCELALSRRKHIMFFSALIAATLYFSYTVFVEQSIYRLFSFLQRVGFVATVISVGLFYLTGLYHKTFVESPKFVHTANKGLRPFNIKLVKIVPTWKETVISWIWNPVYSSRPGGLVKVILSSRSFSSETIEGWELYRQEYWEREYERGKQPTTNNKNPRRKRAISKPSSNSNLR